MTLDKDIEDIKSGIDALRNRPLSMDRDGLYAMVCIGMMGSIYSCDNTNTILEDQQTPQMQIENVVGGEAPEKFYNLNGQRVYLEIDGKPVEQYFAN